MAKPSQTAYHFDHLNSAFCFFDEIIKYDQLKLENVSYQAVFADARDSLFVALVTQCSGRHSEKVRNY
jgi:hypothetical protein